MIQVTTRRTPAVTSTGRPDPPLPTVLVVRPPVSPTFDTVPTAVFAIQFQQLATLSVAYLGFQ